MATMIASFILVVGVGVGVFDTLMHVFRMRCDVSPHLVQSGQEGSRRLVVVFHGLAGFAETQLGEVQGWYLDHGFDVLQIRTSGQRYDPDLVAEVAASAIRHRLRETSYESVVLDGISLGGRAAVDTLQLMELEGYYWPVPKTIILEGAPMTWRSVRGANKYLAVIVSAIPFGPIANFLARPMMLRIFSLPKEENIEAGANMGRLETLLAAAQRTPISLYATQMRSFAGRDEYPYGSLSSLVKIGDHVRFIWFGRDNETVDQHEALGAWRDAFGALRFTVQAVPSDSPHCGFAEAPGANLAAHETALKHLFRT